jgi:hypothetical protein
MSSSASKAQAVAVATFLRMPMIDETIDMVDWRVPRSH